MRARCRYMYNNYISFAEGRQPLFCVAEMGRVCGKLQAALDFVVWCFADEFMENKGEMQIGLCGNVTHGEIWHLCDEKID